jgi:type VI protein secretion system component VasK
VKNIFIRLVGFGRKQVQACKRWFAQRQSKRLDPKLKKPWYLILAPNKAVLEAFLAPVMCEQVELGEDLRVELYLNDAAVFVSLLADAAESDYQTWPVLLRFLKRKRAFRPFHGIVMLFGIKACESQLPFYIQQCVTVRNGFNMQLPCYMVFHDLIQLPGCAEYFQSFPARELSKPFGLSFRYADNQRAADVISAFEIDYKKWVKALQNQVGRLFERTSSCTRRCLLYQFPAHLLSLTPTIQAMIEQLFSAISPPGSVCIRGVYFVSTPSETEEAYFISVLLKQIIFKEGRYLGFVNKVKRYRYMGYQSLRLSLPIMTLLTFLALYQGYQHNLQALAKVKSLLVHSDSADETRNSPLTKLSAMAEIYHEKGHWVCRRLFWARRHFQQHLAALERDCILKKILPSLNKLPLDEIAYRLLERAYSAGRIQLPGDVFAQANTKPVQINVLYTPTGYKDIFQKHVTAIVRQVIQFKNGVESTNDLRRDLRKDYQRHYIQAWQQALHQVRFDKIATMTDAITALNQLTEPASSLVSLLKQIKQNTAGLPKPLKSVNQAFRATNHFRSIKPLQQVRDYLRQIQDAPDQQMRALQAAREFIDLKNKNPMVQLYYFTQSSPPIIQNWLRELHARLVQLILQKAYQQIIVNWRAQVWAFYASHIDGKFPINVKGQHDLKLSDFKSFFGTKGILQDFCHRRIEPFTVRKNQRLKWRAVFGQALPWSHQWLQICRQAVFITKYYFNPQTGDPQIKLSITPEFLSSNASQLRFDLGSQSIIYAHGPALKHQLTWPADLQDQDLSIYVSLFNGRGIKHVYSGIWSIFHLLNHTDKRVRLSSDRIQYQFHLGSAHVTFNLKVTGDHRVLNLYPLLGFRINPFKRES